MLSDLTFSGSCSGNTSENPVSKALGKIARRVFARCAAIVSTIGIQRQNKYQNTGNPRDIAPQSLACWERKADQLPTYVEAGESDLQFGHQCLQRVQEFPSGVMRNWLLVKLLFQRTKELIKLFRLDYGPRDNL
jgi:hypothetical protein